LRHVHPDRLLRGHPQHQTEQRAHDTAMGHTDRVAIERFEPRLHPLEQHLVAFGAIAGRLEVPFVEAARLGRAGIPGFKFGKGETLPVAEAQLDQERLGAIGVRIELHRRADALHRLARTAHRTGDKVEILGVADQFSQPFAVSRRLLAAARIEIGVGLPLQPELGIPLRLAVAHDVDERIHQVFRRYVVQAEAEG